MVIFIYILLVICIGLITARIWVRNTGSKTLKRSLLLGWVACLLLFGVMAAIYQGSIYVAPTKFYKWSWYVVGTGEFVGDEYGFSGGVGSHPVFILIFLPLLVAFSSTIQGLAIVTAKDKIKKEDKLIAKILYFIGYYWLSCVSMGIYPLIHLKQDTEKYKKIKAQLHI